MEKGTKSRRPLRVFTVLNHCVNIARRPQSMFVCEVGLYPDAQVFHLVRFIVVYHIFFGLYTFIFVHVQTMLLLFRGKTSRKMENSSCDFGGNLL